LRENIDVHKTKHRYDQAIQNLKADKAISEGNRKTILKFVWDLQAQGIGLPRLLKYVDLLVVIARGGRKISHGLGKDFDKATVEDVKRFVARVNESHYADWTKQDLRVALKRFYRWLRHLPDDKDPPETSWIRISNSNGKRILPEELLTEEEVGKMLQVCDNSRDRAFLACIFETGGRVAEVLNLRRKHVEFDEYGAALILSGKTGDRRDRIIMAAPALASWMNDHPDKNPDAPLWLVIGVKNHYEPLMYDSARQLLKRLAERAGVKKRVNPHSFRHARASSLANVLTEQQLEQYLGWTPGSRMPKIYVHLSGRDLDSALLRMHGLSKETEASKTPKLTVKNCPRCKQKNGPVNRYCSSCGLPLQVEAALEVEESKKEADRWLDLLLKDVEVQELLRRKVREIMQTFGQKPSTGLPAQPLSAPDAQALVEHEPIRAGAKRPQAET
jgi:integrase/recombinase XerD